MRTLLAAVALVTAGLVGPAMADTVTYDFTVSGFYGNDTATLNAIGGSPVTGSVTYDDDAPFIVFDNSSDPYIPTVTAFYDATVTLDVGGITYVSAPGSGRVGSVDQNSNVDWAAPVNTFSIFGSGFTDSDGNASPFDGLVVSVVWSYPNTFDGLTPTVDQLNGTASYVSTYGYDFNLSTRAGSIVFSAPAPVPLPAGGLLLVTGLAGLGLLRRRKAAHP